MVSSSLLKTVNFSNLSRWSVNSTLAKKIKSNYPLVPLSQIMKRVKEPVYVDNDTLYKRITVRLYGLGVLQRDELYGRDIGTKKQFIARKGQLIISRIDARNGAFGIVPDELDGAIVTNDFWLFDVKNAIPQYLSLVLSSEYFQQYWESQSSGTTNRQRVDEDDFLMSKIALPSIAVQERLLVEYNLKKENATLYNNQIIELNHQISTYLLQETQISFETTAFDGLLGVVSYKKLTRWDPQYLANNVSVVSNTKLVNMSHVITNFMIDKDGKSLRINSKNYKDKTFSYIGMENVEKNSGKAFPQQILGDEILSQTICVPLNYVIYGKLRPYLNKYWQNDLDKQDVICSSEFFVFDTKNIDRQYFIEVLSSQIIQKQLSFLFSGARMPRINEDDFMGLKIPLPAIEKQKQIVAGIAEIRSHIRELENKIFDCNKLAKEQFEEAVFGEA